MANKKTFIVIDGNALLHRAWHAIPPLTAPDGTVVNAAYGFTNVVENVLKDMKPDYLAVAWDLPGGTFRHELYEDYKGTREKKEQELYDQIPLIQNILDAYGVPSLSKKGMEADDIIGTIAKTYGPRADVHVSILTGDLDSLQLVAKDVDVHVFVKGLSQTKVYNEEAVIERYGLSPDQLIDLKTLMGDSSDNIPGIAGIGKKTATDLLTDHGSMEGILDALKRGDVKSSIAKKLQGKESEVQKMKTLVTIVTDVDLSDFDVTDAEVHEADTAELTKLFRTFGFKRLLDLYADKKTVSEKSVSVASPHKEVTIDRLKTDRLTVTYTVKEEDLFGGNLSEVVVSDGTSYARFEHPAETDVKEILNVLSKAKLVVGHDLKLFMHRAGEVQADLFDTMVAAYLIASHTRSFDLKTVAWERFQIKVEDGSSALDQLPIVEKLADVLTKELADQEMEDLSKEIEMPLISILYNMEKEGIEVDKTKLKELSNQFEQELEGLTKKIYKLAGKEFNINSPAQLAELLFDDLQLPTKGIKKTKTGYSTAASELEKLWDSHKVIPLISEYREFAKLKSTYVDALPKLVAKDGRIHTTYHQTVAATGRLSSKDPNLQNIPIRTELGNEIRKAFVAKAGHTFLACDYSQFELRLAAVYAKDDAFIKAFQNGEDIHAVTAAQVMDKKLEDVTKNERRAAKAINFGILYGMGSRNLAKSTGLSQQEAKDFIDRYFDLHPGVQEYMERMKEQAKEHEYVETLFGRRRYLPEINSGIGMLVAQAERMAINMPIQGTQADLVKIAMIHLSEWIEKEARDVRMLLQVHDELVFEIPKKKVDGYAKNIKHIMETVWKSEVPLIVNVEVGARWGEMKTL